MKITLGKLLKRVFATTMLLLSFMLPLLCQQLPSTVMSVDFGSQYIKLAVVSTGKEPLRIVLNDITERKTLNAITFRNGQCFLGPHSTKPMLNSPERGYSLLNMMLGKSFDDPGVQKHLALTTAEFLKNPEFGTVSARLANGEAAPIEYLSAMILGKLVEFAEKEVNRLISGAVITVPPYWGQVERQAVLNVAKIAGLNVLTLVNDISAAGLYYGMFAKASTDPHSVIIIDSGATHTSAALIYVHPNHIEDGKTATLIETKAITTDTELGGLYIDYVVADILAKKFSEKNNGKEVPLGKSYNRLLERANKVKHVLTTNTEVYVTMEDLVGESHLQATITRAEVEAALSNMHSRASALVNGLLQVSNTSIEDIHGIIPIGGNVRVPLIRNDLTKAFGSKIQSGLNEDESIAKGAAWYSATLSHLQVKANTRFRDCSTFPIDLHYRSMDDPSAVHQNLSIYPPNNAVNGHRAIAFKNMESVEFTVSSANQGNLIEGQISGMREAMELMKGKDIISSKLKFWIDLNSSGMVEMNDQPVALFEHSIQVPKNKNVNSNDTTTNSATPNNDQSSPVDSEAVEMETVNTTESVPLKQAFKTLVYSLPTESIEKYSQYILKTKEDEKAALIRSAARDFLESNIYRLKNLLAEAEFTEISKESERQHIEVLLQNASVIVDDEDRFNVGDFQKATELLLESEQAINRRADEHKRRPKLIEKMRDQIKLVKEYGQRMTEDYPDPSTRAQTNEDLTALEEKQTQLATWLEDVVNRQSKASLLENPLVLCQVFEEKTSELRRLYLNISSKKLPPPPPPPQPTATPAEDQQPNESASPDLNDNVATDAAEEAEQQSSPSPPEEGAHEGEKLEL